VSSPTVPKTPRDSSPLKPPMSEMHPSRNHQSMAPPSSGLRLGFTDIKPSSKRDDEFPASVRSTPSKLGVPTSDFTFSFARRANADLKLGPEAQQMMDDIRDQAQQIKAKLVAEREAENLEEEQVNVRRFANPKGKAGRFSAAHMAEFKKMDSITNHPSAFRAQSGRVTPLKAGIKRSQSRANLDEHGSSRSKQPTPASTIASPLKQKAPASTFAEPLSPIKRARQHISDDTSSNRPISRDGSALPRPKSAGIGSAIPRSKTGPNIASLMTPTKSSLARTTSVKTPSHGSLFKSPSKSNLGGIPRSLTTNNLATITLVTEKEPEPAPVPAPVQAKSPTSRFDRVKSMFQRHKASPSKGKSTLPLPATLTSKTPAPFRAQKATLPAPVPLTTPRKLIKRVAFTPEIQRATPVQNSPSPAKSGIPRSRSRNNLGEVYYPALDGILSKEAAADAVSYPDLSAGRPLSESPFKEVKADSTASKAAGTFTFRSDHTIKFGNTSPSFGTSPGQSSVRPVRPSILPTENMPGSFPSSLMMSGTNKENETPRTVFLSVPHGMANKKRNRASTDEQDAEEEAAERAAKKRKQETVPEGDALLAPRLMASAKRPIASPRKPLTAGTPSPMKKKGGISLGRLNMLSRPKMRK